MKRTEIDITRKLGIKEKIVAVRTPEWLTLTYFRENEEVSALSIPAAQIKSFFDGIDELRNHEAIPKV